MVIGTMTKRQLHLEMAVVTMYNSTDDELERFIVGLDGHTARRLYELLGHSRWMEGL